MPSNTHKHVIKYGIALVLILAFSLTTRLYRLDFPNTFYFDEVYHAFTAQSYLHGEKQAYDPWATPPENVAYEWTHPPLSKLIMATMMDLFGETAQGWRMGSVIFGMLTCLGTGILAFELFGSIPVSLTAMGLISLEGLFMTQSRIAMNDVYLVTWILMGFIAYIRWKNTCRLSWLYLTGLSLGLAFATKWSALFGYIMIGFDLILITISANITDKKPNTYSTPSNLIHLTTALCILPVIVYISSYGQYFYLGYNLENFIELQKQMWFYHRNLDATHAYQSGPLQWILNLRPVYLFLDDSVTEKISRIYNLGNTIILYTGLLSIITSSYKALKKRNLYFIVLAYLAFLIPWLFSPRISFFYHYLPCIPFLSISMALFMEELRQNKHNISYAMIIISAITWFIVFYPHNTGLYIPKDRFDSLYYLLPSWI